MHYQNINMAEKNDLNMEDVIGCKRLFVGGLYKDVSKEDLRLKFKPFGDVKDLEIISRHDFFSGVHIKTFAYINIDMSEKNFKKCLTTYNKCNWKGLVLKVENAKEDYLTRLQKEKQAEISVEQIKNSSDVIEVKDLKSAVPGTPVPKKRNWVIGKFGRALPIVYLRRKDGKKIVKFDPSKTVHCLKKLSENNNEEEHSVNDLTWNLHGTDSDLNKTYKTCPMNRKTVKRSLQEGGDTGNTLNKNTKKNLKKKRDSYLIDIQGSKSNESVVRSEDSTSFSSINQRLANDDETSRSSSDSEDSNKLHAFSGKNTVCPNECFSCLNHDISLNSGQRSFTSALDDGQFQPNDRLLKQYSFHDALKACKSHSEAENEKKKIENYSSDDNVELSSSSSESCLLEEEMSDQDPKTSESLNFVPTSPVDSLKAKNIQTSEHFESCIKDARRNKKEISDKLRLETLQEKQEVLKTQKEIIRNALQKVDADYIKGGNHIMFDKDDTGMNEETLNSLNEGKKITGSKALAWLGMNSSSDDENADINEHANEFLGKEHLDGRSGEKLMKLQQKFGHDQRFKMDERFLESDDELESETNTAVLKEDELDKQLKEEKLLSLKVLQNVLGTNSVFIEDNDLDARNLYRDSVETHYDPSRDDHFKFEEEIHKPEHPVSPVENNKQSMMDEIPTTNQNIATQEKFYSVSDSLKGFFVNENKENDMFSFFPECDENKDHSESIAEVTETDLNWKTPVKSFQSLPYDSSASESEDDVTRCKSDVISSNINSKRCLFFHPTDQKMMNELQAESSSFMRKESVENLTRYWVEIRQVITQDYKKKRKDALRRQKKTSYRRIER